MIRFRTSMLNSGCKDLPPTRSLRLWDDLHQEAAFGRETVLADAIMNH